MAVQQHDGWVKVHEDGKLPWGDKVRRAIDTFINNPKGFGPNIDDWVPNREKLEAAR